MHRSWKPKLIPGRFLLISTSHAEALTDSPYQYIILDQLYSIGKIFKNNLWRILNKPDRIGQFIYNFFYLKI